MALHLEFIPRPRIDLILACPERVELQQNSDRFSRHLPAPYTYRKGNLSPTLSTREGGLFRNLDVEFVKNLKSERKIPVDVVLRETEEGFELIYTPIDSKLSPLVGRVGEGFNKEPAKNADKALDTIRTQLSKLGDTPYIAREVRIESKPYFIPISVLNEWRRATIL